jgi:hypothetical protein
MSWLLLVAFAIQLWNVGYSVAVGQVNFAGFKCLRGDQPGKFWLGIGFHCLLLMMPMILFAEVHWDILK